MDTTTGHLAIVGAGRLGAALQRALPGAGGPHGRGYDGADADVVLLCVPDREIAPAAAALMPRTGRLVGHCSGALGLDVLAGHEALSLHPLMTVTGAATSLRGAGAAVAGTTPRALEAARGLADALGMTSFEVADADRAAYHAAASLASNYLLALEDAAEQLLGADRALLAPLVRQTVENWAADGAQAALTGPVVRGDEATVARQRDAVAERAPELLATFDALTKRTRALATRPRRTPVPC